MIMANDLVNPVGSIEEDVYRKRRDYNDINNKPSLRDYDPDVDQYKIRGRGGKVRHQGDFSSNNPYLEQIMTARNNKDLDALYERAVEWEADYYNRQLQLDENRAILEEQRAYDSPEAQMLRARDAGINPDLAGSSGSSGSGISSGSSAGMQIPDMADQTASSKFKNAYDDAAQRHEGLNSASNFIGSISSLVGTIMNGASSLRMLPSRIKVNEASAGLMDAQANELNTLLKGKKTSIDLSNSTELLSQLAGLKDLFTLDTTDDEISSSLKGLGYTEEQVKAGVPIIKKFQQDPALHARYNRAQVDNRFAEQENQQYTTETVSGFVDLAIKLEGEQKRLSFATTQLQRGIAEYVNTEEFAETQGENIIAQEQLVRGNIGLQREMLQQDTEAFFNALDVRLQSMDKIKSQMKNMVDYAAKDNRSFTASEKAVYDRLNAEYLSLYSMTSAEFYKIKDSYLTACEQQYVNAYRLDEKGRPRNLVSLEAYTQMQDITFNDYVQHNKTGAEFATMYVSCFSTALRDLMIGGAAVAGAAKGGGFPGLNSSGGYKKHGNVGFQK